MVNAQHNSNSWEVHIEFSWIQKVENVCEEKKKAFVSQNIYYIELKQRSEEEEREKNAQPRLEFY